MNIHLATDHAGFEMKEFLKEALLELGHNITDHGAHEYNDSDDYPDYIKLAASEVSINPDENIAIIFGGSGQGEAITANRFANVRATTYYHFDPEIIKLSREHNDANILSIGARFLSNEEMLESVLFWLEIEFEGGRHLNRIEKIEIDTYIPQD
ncbi:MAG: RpiB/LacA/LacB family sugar-phosphate isomerase [Candidatus Pacebacteria bacterium]|nr:RpiB/LacA/LacB family sugar-phosphate isomerase [Candidatus Paceibacterota bacterium]